MDYDNIQINTTQNVLVGYEPAGIFERGLAYILDLLFLLVYFVIVYIITAFVYSGSQEPGDSYYVWYYVLNTILAIPAMLYSLLCEVFMNGQSFGKKIMVIKVVKLDGTQPSLGAYLLRWMMRIIDLHLLSPIAPLVGLISVFATKNSQRLGDLTAGTTVIKMTSRASLRHTILYKVQPGYKITFMEVGKLNDRDIAIIKEVYQHCRQSRDYNALLKLADKVRIQMGLQGTNMTPEQFINTVLADYTQYEFDV
jgi:uncharacterized RDD family membrane protein YckC